MTEDIGQMADDRGQKTDDRGQKTEDRGQRMGFGCQVSGVSPTAGRGAASLIEKEATERRTSNTERPTSNNVFCQF